MAKRRIRRPGGGRKPQGEFSKLASPFSLRMPNEMRERLKLEAAARNWSEGQELLRRLQDSFNRDMDRENDPALQGLLFFIAQIAEAVSLVDLAESKYLRVQLLTTWRTDPFLFKTFKIAVAKFLDDLAVPKGRIRLPSIIFPENMPEDEDGKPIRTPQAFAKWIVQMLWTTSYFLDGGIAFKRDPLRPNASKALERGHYHLPRARKALELKTKAAERAEERKAAEKLGEHEYKIQIVKRIEANQDLDKYLRERLPKPKPNRRR
jgi:hypothetical protein